VIDGAEPPRVALHSRPLRGVGQRHRPADLHAYDPGSGAEFID
jgi:hypothetical protein